MNGSFTMVTFVFFTALGGRAPSEVQTVSHLSYDACQILASQKLQQSSSSFRFKPECVPDEQADAVIAQQQLATPGQLADGIVRNLPPVSYVLVARGYKDGKLIEMTFPANADANHTSYQVCQEAALHARSNSQVVSAECRPTQ
jgi:hypothetical protein